MPDYKTLKISFFQKIKLLASNQISTQEFINTISPSIESQLELGDYFVIDGDPNARILQYTSDSEGEYVTSMRANGNKVYLNVNPSSNSLFDKFKHSSVYESYDTVKQFYTKGLKVDLDNE